MFQFSGVQFSEKIFFVPVDTFFLVFVKRADSLSPSQMFTLIIFVMPVLSVCLRRGELGLLCS